MKSNVSIEAHQVILNMFHQDTNKTVVATYQEAKAKGENVMLTLKCEDCVETVQLSASRPVAGLAAWRDYSTRNGWTTPAAPPLS